MGLWPGHSPVKNAPTISQALEYIKSKPTNMTDKALWLSHQPLSQPHCGGKPPFTHTTRHTGFPKHVVLCPAETLHTLWLLEHSASHSSFSPNLPLPTLQVSTDKLLLQGRALASSGPLSNVLSQNHAPFPWIPSPSVTVTSVVWLSD